MGHASNAQDSKLQLDAVPNLTRFNPLIGLPGLDLRLVRRHSYYFG